jgi:hypothetical protein
MFTKIDFVLHFDAGDIDDYDYEFLNGTPEVRMGYVLEAVPDLAKLISVIEVEGVSGELNLSIPEKFIATLNGRFPFEMVRCHFAGMLASEEQVAWPRLRDVLKTIRSSTFPASGVYSGFDRAPVDISLESLYSADEPADKPIWVFSNTAIIAYLDALANAASANKQISEFLEFFEPEITQFRKGSQSQFLESWFSTELLLTQKEAVSWEIENEYFLSPKFLVSEFEWSKPQEIPNLLRWERIDSPTKMVWYSPMRANMYTPSSDFGHFYGEASNQVDKYVSNSFSYSPLKTALLLQCLWHALDESPSEETEWLVDFMNDFESEINSVTEQIEEEFEWDSGEGTELNGEKADHILAMDLPDNLQDVWLAWLKLIGRSKQ